MIWDLRISRRINFRLFGSGYLYTPSCFNQAPYKTVVVEVNLFPIEYRKLFTKLMKSTLALGHIEYQFLHKRFAHTIYVVSD